MQRSALIFVVITLCCLSTALYGGVVLSENFDELTPREGATLVGAFSTINGTNVDIVANGGIFGYLCQAPESGNCIDMDGGYAWGNPQGQLQSNMLFPTGSYFLSFDLIGSQRGDTASTTVTFGNYNQTFTLTSNDDIGGIVVNQPVRLRSPGYLLFVSDTPGQIGDLLDNVVVTTAGIRLRSRPACSLWGLRFWLLSVSVAGDRIESPPARIMLLRSAGTSTPTMPPRSWLETVARLQLPRVSPSQVLLWVGPHGS